MLIDTNAWLDEVFLRDSSFVQQGHAPDTKTRGVLRPTFNFLVRVFVSVMATLDASQ